ncbi:hypothetical protein FCL47_12265 [Desulfopila sp. IMCC35006]|uniref:hypothetical protein n=1 Tax=Desulfopila sp. IMCC35006 TaxID=2569542 RepID=UPI0010AD6C69|nr:hypothetical protein [Desulfopila sp. IMCC35006]TKB25864.1 hypothetical protein FCL47_12265 [Desulfopila sp. IMCC35006]
MIQIERIRLHLPAGFEHRAATIVRRVGEVLARQSVPQDVSIDIVSIAPQRIHPITSDDEIAQMIANQIIAGYAGGLR